MEGREATDGEPGQWVEGAGGCLKRRENRDQGLSPDGAVGKSTDLGVSDPSWTPAGLHFPHLESGNKDLHLA